MKLLFDQHLSPRLVESLADIYPASNHVYPLGLAQVSDREIWEHARREGFLIVTKDVDSSDLSMFLGFPPKVSWIRRGNCKTSAIEAMLRHHQPNVIALDKDTIMGVLTLF